jgi:membrane-bound lytic murein transglycosylase B
MTINLKNTLLFSATLALLLNVWQFASSYKQREDALAPAWADASTAVSTQVTNGPSASDPTRPKLTPAPLPTPTPTPTPIPTPVAVAPSSDELAVASALTNAGLKPQFASLYMAVQQRTDTPWQLLAAVHEVETGQSGDTGRTSYAGAEGPMQFMPETFYYYASASDGDGKRDIESVTDAMYTAGRYLAAGGAADGNYSTALYHYNHSNSYVAKVLGIANRLGL